MTPLRHKEALQAEIASVGVEHAADLQPGYGGAGRTHCNLYVERLCVRLGCPLPAGRLARDQIEWMAGPQGHAAGWWEVTGPVAQQRAELGFPSLATWTNPEPESHCHIAMVCPWQSGPRGVYIAQAGSTCFSYGPISRGFGTDKLLRFFTTT